jgi:hypothetical protein
VCPSFLAGKQHSLIQTGLINCLADSTERVKPLLAALTLLKELSNGLFDQFIRAAIATAGEFLLDSLSQVRRQCDFHGWSPDFILRFWVDRFFVTHHTTRVADGGPDHPCKVIGQAQSAVDRPLPFAGGRFQLG